MRVWLLFSLCVTAFAKHEIYAGWKSYYVAPASAEQSATLGSLESKLEVDFFVRPREDREGVVLVKPQYQQEFLNMLLKEGIAHRVHQENIKAQLDAEDELIEARHVEFRLRNTREQPYDNYVRLDEIYNYMDVVAAAYPDIVTLVTAGRTLELRPIKYLKISSSNFEDESKTVIFVDATMHAREWITTPAATYAIHRLVENRTDSELLDNFDWIILPVANPDGYEYSHTDERFWRKSRSIDSNIISLLCRGVDGNRNFDFDWGNVGTSTSPCAETYGGTEPFSEIETRVVRDILHEYLNRMALYITIHSYGSMILYPWGNDGSLSPNAFGLHTVGVAMADAIYQSTLPIFPRYSVGNSFLVIGYGASGAAEDYAHSIGVPLTYTYELPGFGSSVAGFHVPPIFVRGIAEDTWAGISTGAKRAREIVRSK